MIHRVSEEPTSDTGTGTGSRTRRPSRAGRGGSQLELALLGVLADGELHGYELKKRVDAVLPPWSSVSFGSLYPTLNRLEKAGDVAAASNDGAAASNDGAAASNDGAADGTDDPDTPSTGALSGELATFRSRLRERSPKPVRSRRGRKVYTITADGRARLVDLLAHLDPGDDRTFVLQIAFARHLGQAQRLALFSQRRAVLVRRLDEATNERPAHDRWREALRGRAVATLTDEITWIDQLIATDGGSIDPPTVPGPTLSAAGTASTASTGGNQ
jgi:DNA-binding PadR family transcriptional regulator